MHEGYVETRGRCDVSCMNIDRGNDEYFMSIALNEAEAAASEGEVPIGAVLVKDGNIIASAHNRRENDCDATAHAEILCIRKASNILKGWNLHDCELYVTLEPCPMCTGAAINARIKRIIYGAKDMKAGSVGGMVDLTSLPYNHRPEVTGGVMENECLSLLKNFFAYLRIRKERFDNKKCNVNLGGK